MVALNVTTWKWNRDQWNPVATGQLMHRDRFRSPRKLSAWLRETGQVPDRYTGKIRIKYRTGGAQIYHKDTLDLVASLEIEEEG